MKQVGIIGYPVAHSLSPRMHRAAFEALAIDASYNLWETQPGMLPQRIASLRSPQVLGANVTIPYKQQVIHLLDECDLLAVRIGAVNTIVNYNGRLVGYNTDAPGFMQALAECAACPFDSRGKKVVILGTGGAARAASVALLNNGVAELTMLGRTTTHVNAFLHDLRVLIAQMRSPVRIQGITFTSTDAVLFLSATDLLVNATPVGLRIDDPVLPIDINVLPSSALVMDMIFNPPCTPLLRAAEERGCPTLNGLSMLLYQGALAFELWTDHPAPIERMRAALGLEM